MTTSRGRTVAELSRAQPVLLVFLRHFACTFCREALQDLSNNRGIIDAMGATLVLVHMSEDETANEYFDNYRLSGVEHVADPGCQHYRTFGLAKGTARQLFGLHSWIRGFQAGVLDGHGVGYRPLGDGFQMPGVFVIKNGQIGGKFVHKLAGDRPEYVDLLRECCS